MNRPQKHISAVCRTALLSLFLAWSPVANAAEAPRHWTSEWPQTDFSKSLVAFGEIFSGGPPKDGIPAIDAPVFVTADAALKDLAPSEPVLSLSIGTEARAYPLRVLIWHEIVNDEIAGTPVAVTYCPLCNSGIVFDRSINGEVTTFGTTGKLRNSDLVMYDRATESWWQQFEGKAIIGKHAGTVLKRHPARHESLGDFAARYPGGKVLAPDNPNRRAYGQNPYRGYDSAARPFLYTGQYDGPGRPLMRVVAVEGADKAWSLDYVRKAGRIEDGALVITWKPGRNSALDKARIDEGRDVGTVAVTRSSGSGAVEDAIYDLPFAFAFNAFRPDIPIVHTKE